MWHLGSSSPLSSFNLHVDFVQGCHSQSQSKANWIEFKKCLRVRVLSSWCVREGVGGKYRTTSKLLPPPSPSSLLQTKTIAKKCAVKLPGIPVMPISADEDDGEKFIGAMPWAVPCCVCGLRKMIGFDACDADCDLGREGFAEPLKQERTQLMIWESRITINPFLLNYGVMNILRRLRILGLYPQLSGTQHVLAAQLHVKYTIQVTSFAHCGHGKFHWIHPGLAVTRRRPISIQRYGLVGQAQVIPANQSLVLRQAPSLHLHRPNVCCNKRKKRKKQI